MKVLILTYYWPPSGGGGVQRWLKFAANLKKLGCTPIIYTPSNPDVPILDPTLLDDVPDGIEILTTPIFEPSRLLRKISGKAGSERFGADGGDKKQGVLSRLSLWIRGNLFIPDARVRWVKPSVKFLSTWLVENHVDVIITTGPPHSVHLIGLGLKKKNPKLKWVADFRDPWSDMDYLDDFKMGKRARNKMVEMECEVTSNADRLIVTSRSAEGKLIEGKNKICLFIPNGWDAADFPKSIPSQEDSETVRFGHFGSLHGSRNAIGLWKAFAALKEKGQKFELTFAGSVSPEITRHLIDLGLKDNCVFHGNLGHRESIEKMLLCDALLLIHNESDSATRSTPGKLFEYIAASKPIISICRQKGDLASMLDGFGLPHTQHNDEVGALEMLLQYENQEAVDPAPFTRMKQAEKLLEVIRSTQ